MRAGDAAVETSDMTPSNPHPARRLGLVTLATALVVTGGASRALAGAEHRTVPAAGIEIRPVQNLPEFEIDGFALRNVGPYSGMGAISAVPCWKIGPDCSSAPSGASVANAIWDTGTLTYANAPITDDPQRYQLMFSGNLRTLLLGDGMPMDRAIVDRAAAAGYEAIMVNWEHPDDPSLKHPIASLRNASHWAHADGMKFGVAMGGTIMLEVCPALGYTKCPTLSWPLIVIAEFERERKFMLEVLKDTDVFTFELQSFVLLDQAKWASENLDLATVMHTRALNNHLTNFTYLAEMTTMHSNHSLSPTDYPSASQYLKSWRGIKGSVGPNTSSPIQGLFLLVSGVACAHPEAVDPDKRDCHSDPNPGTDDRVVQMTRFLRTAFTVKAS
jgi:hypothetical protein